MRRSTFALFSAFLPFLFALTACSPGRDNPGRRDGSVGDDGAVVDTSDEDGDTISDTDEGRRDGTDTDGDGALDFEDDDSDGDGIPDAIEAGDDQVTTPPYDSDMDGTPDFRDLDSDDNGISDAEEGSGDADGDGDPDFRDPDDDNDFVQDADELGSPPAPTLDTDGDGLPTWRDPDSDNDNILDGHERGPDTDGDGLMDWEDPDSDDDGWPDMDEAGDADLRTAPVDTDMDGDADFRDPDSDNDGLSDRDELEAGTSRTSEDTDGDMVSDLIEVAAGTDALDGTDSPRTRGDFVFVVPYMEDPDPERDTLEFRTNIQFADVYFAFDISGSMSAELSAMRNPTSGVPAIIAELRCAETGDACAMDSDCPAGNVCNSTGMCSEDPRTAGCIPDIWTGVGQWGHIDTYRNLVSLQPDPAVTAAAVPYTDSITYNEAPYQPAACIADGTNCTNSDKNCATMGVGCPGFRTDAVRIYIQITDADQQCSGARCSTFTAAYVGSELMRQSIKFVSLVGVDDDSSHSSTPESVAREIALASGTVDDMGDPYVYNALDAAVVSEAADAVRDLVNSSGFRVTIEAADEPDDDGDALQFIDYLVVNTSGGPCTMVSETEDTDGDGHDDAFPSLLPGTPVCWDVIPLRNETVEPAASPLVFRARLTVKADGSPVDSRVVYFLVPPDVEIIIPG